MDYELYHDESQEHGYWHGMLLVPNVNKILIIDQLEKIREHTKYQHPIRFKRIRGFGKIFDCEEAWLDFVIGCMITKYNVNIPYPIFTGEKRKGEKQYVIFDKIVENNPIGVKFILFRDKERFINMSNVLDHGGKIETSFKIGMKGGLHFLFSEVDHINITRIHFDGYKHLGRRIDAKRIIERLNGLREYCEFKDTYIIEDESSDHFAERHQNYDDCQFLQLTDLLVGTFRTAFGFLGQGKRKGQMYLAEPVKMLVERYKEGYARMQNSRWRNSFCMSESFIEDGIWKFQDIEFNKDNKKCQLQLFRT